jgi:DNA/RNA endonuclease G (NUC1)
MYSRNKLEKTKKKNTSKSSNLFISQNLSTTISNNLLNYKNIFSNNKKNNSIIYLKKKEFDIFYSCKYKYPILVKETVTSQTGITDTNEERIDRSKIIDPFMEDTEIPLEYRHSIEDYKKYMTYGVSMGHNAAAGQHKTNMNIYAETFLLSNITPQEMVLNSGLWALMENWCKKLGENTNLYDITVFTGSIPSKKYTNIKEVGISMNIPEKMFKIICFRHVNNPNITFMEILITNNSPYYINPKIINYDISSYLVPVKSWKWFQTFSGININNLLVFYGFNSTKIKPFRNTISMTIHLHRLLQLLMKKSMWYGYLIYSPTVEELDKKWEECKLQNFDNLNYHKEFYELVRQKLINESIIKSKSIILFPLSSKNNFKIFNANTNISNHKFNNTMKKKHSILYKSKTKKMS